MQNKLCDVTKCLPTVAHAAGVLSGRDRKKKLEIGLLFDVLFLDWQISFGVRLFFVTRCPPVPLVACQKAQTRKNGANGATFRVKIPSWSNAVFCGVDGREGCKRATTVLYVGNCLFTGSQRRKNSTGNGLWRFVGKIPHWHQTPVFVEIWWRETPRYFSVPARFPDFCRLILWRAVESREPGCNIPWGSGHGGWREHQQGSWQILDLQRQIMKGKIQSLGKATFKTTSRRWEMEPGSLKHSVSLSVTISWRRGKKLWNSTRVECCSCMRTWAIRKRTRKSILSNPLYHAATAAWVDHGLRFTQASMWSALSLLHLVGDSAKELGQHTVQLDTSCPVIWCEPGHCVHADYTVAGRKIWNRASMSFPFGQTSLWLSKACHPLSRTCILTHVLSRMLWRSRLTPLATRYWVFNLVKLQASNFQEQHHLSIHKRIVTSRLVKVCTLLTTLIPPLVPPTDSDECLQDA